jgi:type VI secretion system secreted protein Hcp
MSVEYFLKITGPDIKGESQQEKHKEEIELLGWSFSGHNPVSIQGAGLSAGKVDLADLSITKRNDKASPKLLELMVTGKHVKEVLLACCKSTGDKTPADFLHIKLNHVFVSSYQLSGSAGGDFETESLTLSYAKIHHDYKSQDEQGVLKSAGTVMYDLALRKSG